MVPVYLHWFWYGGRNPFWYKFLNTFVQIFCQHRYTRPRDQKLHSPTVYPMKYAHGFCFAVLCCGYTLIFPYPSGLLHWHCGNLTIVPVPAKQPWWIWINTSCEFIMNDCITTTKQSTTKPCAYFLGYTVTWWLLDCQWGMKHGLPLAGVAGCVIRWYKYRRVDTWSPLDSG